MHDREVVHRALSLAGAGLSTKEISSLLGVPRATLRDWLAGAVPLAAQPSHCAQCGAEHDLAQLSGDYVYLLGLYLGDGWISRLPRTVFRLRLALDLRYPQIIEDAAAAIHSVRTRKAHVRVAGAGYAEVSSYWKAWPCLIPQHGRGLKHERRIALTSWQRGLVEDWPEQLVRGLVHSDGCRFTNSGRAGWSAPRYSFTQRSRDVQNIFRDACDLLGVRWTEAGIKTYVSRKADVARLDEFIGPKC